MYRIAFSRASCIVLPGSAEIDDLVLQLTYCGTMQGLHASKQSKAVTVLWIIERSVTITLIHSFRLDASAPVHP
jgi:hypothetical protein